MQKNHSLYCEKLIITVLFLYTLFWWVGEHFIKREVSDPLDWYFLLSHVFFALFSIFLFKKEIKKTPFIWPSKNTLINSFLILMIYAIVVALKYPEKIIWLDEHLQFIYGSHVVKGNIIERSLDQHQPPLDYLLMGASRSIWGIRVFAVKFHALIFGGLTILLLPQLCSRYFPKNQFSYIVSLLIVFSPFFAGYSLEGRPYALTMFGATLFLLFLHEVITENKGYPWLLLSGLLVYSTTSLQNHVFLFSTVVLSSLFFWKKVKHRLGFTWGLASLWRLPIDIRVNQYTEKEHLFIDRTKTIAGIYENIGIRIENFISANSAFVGGLFVLVIIYSIYQYFRKRDQVALFHLSLPLCFIALYSIVWDLNINSNLNPRYNISAIPSFALLIGYFFSNIHFNISKRGFYSLKVVIILVGFYVIHKPLLSYNIKFFRPHWHKAYQYINTVVDNNDDIVFNIAFVGYSDFRGKEHTGAIFYGNKQVQDSILKFKYIKEWMRPHTIYYDEKRDYLKKYNKVIIIIDRFEQDPQFWKYQLRDLRSVEHFGGLDVLVFEKNKSLHKAIGEIFDDILVRHGTIERTTPFLESLIYMEKKFGDLKKTRTYLERYKNIRFTDRKTLRGFTIDKEKEHRKRVKTLEALVNEP